MAIFANRTTLRRPKSSTGLSEVMRTLRRDPSNIYSPISVPALTVAKHLAVWPLSFSSFGLLSLFLPYGAFSESLFNHCPRQALKVTSTLPPVLGMTISFSAVCCEHTGRQTMTRLSRAFSTVFLSRDVATHCVIFEDPTVPNMVKKNLCTPCVLFSSFSRALRLETKDHWSGFCVRIKWSPTFWNNFFAASIQNL